MMSTVNNISLTVDLRSPHLKYCDGHQLILMITMQYKNVLFANYISIKKKY